jgi:hypothetical protein
MSHSNQLCFECRAEHSAAREVRFGLPAPLGLAVVNPAKAHHFRELIFGQVGETDICCCSHVLS